MSLNKAILIGRLTKDPELRYTSSGVAVTQFTLAVDRQFAREGEERGADFIPIVVWRAAAEACANHLKKGSQVAVDGRIQTRNYENNEGRRVYVTEVVANDVRFLSKAKGNDSQGEHTGSDQGAQADSSFFDEENLPF